MVLRYLEMCVNREDQRGELWKLELNFEKYFGLDAGSFQETKDLKEITKVERKLTKDQKDWKLGK